MKTFTRAELLGTGPIGRDLAPLLDQFMGMLIAMELYRELGALEPDAVACADQLLSHGWALCRLVHGDAWTDQRRASVAERQSAIVQIARGIVDLAEGRRPPAANPPGGGSDA